MVLPALEWKTCEALTLPFLFLSYWFLALSNSAKLDVIEYECTVLGKYEVISITGHHASDFFLSPDKE